MVGVVETVQEKGASGNVTGSMMANVSQASDKRVDQNVVRREGVQCSAYSVQNHAGCAGKKTKSISKLSERTYQHSNFMDCGVIRKNEGRRREERTPEDSVNELGTSKTTGIPRLTR